MNHTEPKLATEPRQRPHDVRECPRCGATHAAHPFRKLQRPSNMGGCQFTWWATCPNTGEPVLADLPEVTTA